MARSIQQYFDMQLFETVISQFQSNSQYQKFIKESEKEYDIKIYRMSAFSLAYARAIYNEINQKYVDKVLGSLPQGWYENERRLYVWFIICFMQLKLIEPLKFVDAYEKYWRNISETFWNKEVFFLKYQLLNILKTKGRTFWKSDEDQFLQRAYKKHQVGEWNEVAKDFYKFSEGKYFKTPKQCRERWQNHLNKDIKKGEWSTHEDLTIFEFVESMGTKWAKIVPLLNHSRTEHMIKNRYKSLISKAVQEKNINQSQASSLIIQELKAKLLEESENPGSKKEQGRHNRNHSHNHNKQQLFIERVQSQSIQFDEKALEHKQPKHIQKDKQSLMKNSNSSRLKQGFELSRQAKQVNHQFKIDCSRIDEFLGKNLVDQSLYKSNNSFFSKMILFSSNNHFPNNNSLNIGFPEDRSFFGHSIIKEEQRNNHIFFDSQSLRSKKSKNNESIIGKYISES